MTAADVVSRLERGDKLHMQIVNGRRIWWFESPHENVPDKLVGAALNSGGSFREAGDSLFGLPLNSQTWLSCDQQAD